MHSPPEEKTGKKKNKPYFEIEKVAEKKKPSSHASCAPADWTAPTCSRARSSKIRYSLIPEALLSGEPKTEWDHE